MGPHKGYCLLYWHIDMYIQATVLFEIRCAGYMGLTHLGGAGGFVGHNYSYLHDPPHNEKRNMRTYRFRLVNWMCLNLK